MKSRKLLTAGTVALLALNLVSCGTEDEAASSSSSLSGSWLSDCYSEVEDGETKYVRDKIVFTTTVFAREMQEFSDSACATGTSTYAISGTITVGDEVTTPSGATALDLAMTAVAQMTLMADTHVTYFNEQNVCGGGWEKDTAKSVSAAGCTDDTGKDFTSMLGKTWYSIYKIEDDTLSIGVESGAQDGKTEATRETSFNTNTLTKQASNT